MTFLPSAYEVLREGNVFSGGMDPSQVLTGKGGRGQGYSGLGREGGGREQGTPVRSWSRREGEEGGGVSQSRVATL